MKRYAKSKPGKGYFVLLLPAMVFLTLSCSSEEEAELAVVGDPVEYVAVEGAIVKEFSNFVTVEFRGIEESAIQQSGGIEGMKGTPFTIMEVTVDGVRHELSDKSVGNGSLEIDGQELRGAHFVISAPWEVVPHAESQGYNPFERALDFIESTAKPE